MDARSCPACTAPAAPPALECAYCGSALHLSYHQPADAPGDEAPGVALHPMCATKLRVMWLCTLGMYQIFWFYRNWKLRNELRGRGVTAPLRAIFAPFFAYSLFREVRSEARSQGAELRGALPLALACFLLPCCGRLPEPLWVISLGAVAPLLPVQRAINEANARSARPAPENARYSTANRWAVALGGTFLALALIGTFLPEP